MKVFLEYLTWDWNSGSLDKNMLSITMYCQNIFGDHRVFEDLKEFEIVKIERDRMVGYEETRSRKSLVSLFLHACVGLYVFSKGHV